MASFNQSPLGQTALTLGASSLTLGSAAPNAPTATSSVTFVLDGSLGGPTFVLPSAPLRPSWRRESKIVSANE